MIPRGIRHAFGKKAVLHHFCNAQIFKNNQVKSINDFSGFLISKVISAIGDSAMNLFQNFNAAFEWLAVLNFFRQSAISFTECFFTCLEKLWIFYLFIIEKCCEGRQANVNADSVFDVGNRHLADFLRFASKDSEPTGNFALDCTGFNHAFNRTVKFNFDPSNFGKMKFVADYFESALNVAKTIVSVVRLETRKTDFGITSTKEIIKGFTQTTQNILQNLRVNVFEFRAVNFNQRQLNGLRVKVNRKAIEFPSIAAFLKGGIIEFGAQRKRLFKLSLNGFGKILNLNDFTIFILNNHLRYYKLKQIHNGTRPFHKTDKRSPFPTIDFLLNHLNLPFITFEILVINFAA